MTFTLDLRLEVEEDADYDVAAYMDAGQTGKFSLNGRAEKAQLWFRDLTEEIPQVRTEYRFQITDAQGAAIAEKSFQREDLTLDKDGRYKLSFKDDFDLAPDALAALRAGRVLIVNYEAVRHGRKFNPNPYVIKKRVSLSIP
ncbi:MAG TPA: hypothetical protein PL182_12480 [Pseudobdellovibrionaceae bacterium]|nr:hypothetical protein [Pseudobdellovibrionaceae bacterium]